MSDPNLSSFIWSVADLLRGDYRQSEYGKVILPFCVLRRFDCVLEATKAAVLIEKEKREKAGLNPEPFLLRVCSQLFYNTSPLDLKKLMGGRPGSHRRKPARLYAGVLARGARHLRELRFSHADKTGQHRVAICRGIYARIVPVEKQAEFFGFNAMAGRVAKLLGPLVFGFVSSSTGSQRIGLMSLLVFFVAGGAVISMCRLEGEARKVGEK